MKILIFATFFLLTTISSALAIDEASLQNLRQQGFQVRMGELTGAGSKLSLARLAGFIHPSGIVMKEDCKSIAIQPTGQGDPKISDVTKVEIDQGVIGAQEFEGFFTFQ